MEDFLAAFRTALGHETPVAFTPTRNPYKGLGAFGEADAGDFFGRRDAVDELVSLVAGHRLVAVVGPSGSGKSSLVKAGLVPAMRTGGVGGHGDWVVAEMFPGGYPLEELASALTQVAVEATDGLIDELDQDDQGLVRVLGRILPMGTHLLLVIDQFEELFTLTRREAARSRLLGALVALATDPRSETRIVLTLRADFFDRPLQHPEFGAVLREGIHALTTPTDEQLADAIRRPAETVGVTFEAGLPERIVADLSGSPGTLPLLQYTLTHLFERRRTDQITHEAYRDSGGVMGALGSRADGVFAGLDARVGSTVRQVFLRLVTVQPSGEATRHRARMLELNSLADPQDVAGVLAAFGDARLLTFDRDPVSRGPTVEVAHEALLSRWPRLAGWVESAREDLLLHRRLAEAVEEWDQRDRATAISSATVGWSGSRPGRRPPIWR
jgi:energy-coupling factor transporter ATP-binding protein EcfA2